MSQRYNGSTQRPKPRENQVGILRIYSLFQKIQQKASGSREGYWGYGLVYENTPEKLLYLPLKSCLVVQRRVQLDHSSQILVVCVMAAC